MKDLALKIAQVNGVVVDESNSSNARSGQVQRGWTAQSTGTNHEHTRGCEAALTLKAHIGQADVPGVASNINHGSPKAPSHIKGTASMDVVFQPLFDVHGG